MVTWTVKTTVSPGAASWGETEKAKDSDGGWMVAVAVAVEILVEVADGTSVSVEVVWVVGVSDGA